MRSIIPIAFLYSGTIPFVLVTLAALISSPDHFFREAIPKIVTFFAFFITTFMIGSYWGQAVETYRIPLFLASVIGTFSLLGIGVIMMAMQSWNIGALLFIAFFWALYICDRRTLKTHNTLKHYTRHRLIATCILTTCLSVLLLKGL